LPSTSGSPSACTVPPAVERSSPVRMVARVGPSGTCPKGPRRSTPWRVPKGAGLQCTRLLFSLRGLRGGGCYCTWENGMTVLRSLLFVPGNRADMLAKAATLTPDAFVPDMEDSVPVEEKTNARTVTAACVPQLAQGGALVIPRVNSLDTGLLEDDLAAVVGPHIYGVSVGKINTPRDIGTIADLLARLEKRVGLPVGQ